MDVLRNMQIFVEVAKARSFRRAAEILGMPNATVSRRIAELERGIGLRLFNRTTRRVELTESGQRYFERCGRVIQEAMLAHEELADMQARPIGTVRVSLPVDFSVIILSPMLVHFARMYPGIRLELDLTPSQADLAAGSVDLAIRMGPPTEQRLIARQIADLKLGLYASPVYLKQYGMPATPAALREHECLRMRDGPWTLWAAKGDRSETIEVTGQITANNVGMLRQLALAGLGIMINAESWAADDVDQGSLVRVLPGWSPPNAQAYALTETRLLPAKVRVFIDFLTECMDSPPNRLV